MEKRTAKGKSSAHVENRRASVQAYNYKNFSWHFFFILLKECFYINLIRRIQLSKLTVKVVRRKFSVLDFVVIQLQSASGCRNFNQQQPHPLQTAKKRK